jgi:hypothetical protein
VSLCQHNRHYDSGTIVIHASSVRRRLCAVMIRVIENLSEFVVESVPEGAMVRCRVTRSRKGVDRGQQKTYLIIFPIKGKIIQLNQNGPKGEKYDCLCLVFRLRFAIVLKYSQYTANILYRNSKHIFPEKELGGHSPNSYIHVSVCDLYIPTIGLHVLLQENRWTDHGNIKSLTDT